MTEEEWMVADHAGAMLEFLHDNGKTTERKLRLFACACGRRIWHLLGDDRSFQAVELAERSADELVNDPEWEGARQAALAAWKAAITPACRDAHGPRTARCAATRAALLYLTPIVLESAGGASFQAVNALRRVEGADFMAVGKTAWAEEADFLRCIWGVGAFHAATLPPLGSSVHLLAEAIYTNRAYEQLPILADALEEAGVSDADILAHCRGPGPHVRGCWVVDLILGKT
jgi:hypothetical protein